MENSNKNNLKEEIIEELNLKIYQDDRFFKYGLDSVELCKFVKKVELKEFNLDTNITPIDTEKYKNYNVIDICSGTGIIGLIIQRIFNLENISFIEKQKYFAELNEFNAEKNLEKNAFNVYNIDICKENNKLLKELESKTDIILTNPPYKKFNSGINSKHNEKTIAKIEDEDFLENLFKFSSRILKDNGKLYMVNRVDRIVDISQISRKYNLEPKTIQFVVNNKNMPRLVLIQFIKNAKEFLKVLENRIIRG